MYNVNTNTVTTSKLLRNFDQQHFPRQRDKLNIKYNNLEILTLTRSSISHLVCPSVTFMHSLLNLQAGFYLWAALKHSSLKAVLEQSLKCFVLFYSGTELSKCGSTRLISPLSPTPDTGSNIRCCWCWSREPMSIKYFLSFSDLGRYETRVNFAPHIIMTSLEEPSLLNLMLTQHNRIQNS